jgi:hypothetical protein
MRRFAFVALLSLSALPGIALAQNAAPSQAGAGPNGGHQWQHHGWKHGHDGAEFLNKFYAANTTHDGHLTLAQAKAASLTMIVDHFPQIDSKNRGYVTFYDIQAWHLDGMAKHLEEKANQLRAQD